MWIVCMTQCATRSDGSAHESLIGVAGVVGVLGDARAVRRGPSPHTRRLARLPTAETPRPAAAGRDPPLLVGSAGVRPLSDLRAIAVVRALQDQAAVAGRDANMAVTGVRELKLLVE